MFNSKWNDKVSFRALIEITSKFTVQQMLERDMFQERLKEEKPIYLHELLYPVAQAIDCVKMDVDLELGGSDQTFNMLAGRVLMKALKNKEKFVMTTKLLVDAEGEKVGKTTGNALFLSSPPEDFYGGIMSFPDEVLPLGFELLTEVPMNEVRSLDFRGKPMELKKRLALETVRIIYGGAAANQAQNHFEKVFQNKQLPETAAEFEVKSANEEIGPLLLGAKMVKSLSGVKRLVKQGAIEIDGKVITDYHLPLRLKNGSVIRIGKTRFLRIKIS
jgi:tyrosyl-tRNA synthetase